MTQLRPIRYEPGMTLGDFQAMIAAGDTRYQHTGPADAGPRRRTEVTAPDPGPRPAWRAKMDELRGELRRVKSRLATADKRIARCEQLHSTRTCPHPFDPDAVTIAGKRHPKGLVLRIGFTCPSCRHHVDLPPKLVRA